MYLEQRKSRLASECLAQVGVEIDDGLLGMAFKFIYKNFGSKDLALWVF